MAGLAATPRPGGETQMDPKNLMKPDLFSAIVLLGSVGLVLVSLLLIVAAALTRA
jgi:hypothetical protein